MQVHARAVDVEVAQRHVGQATHGVARAQQALQHHLAGAVPGLVVVRVMIFAGRERVGQAVDRCRRGGDDLLDAGFTGGLHDVEAAVAHDLHRPPRVGRAGGDAEGREMDHGVHAIRRSPDSIGVADVALHEAQARILHRAFHVRQRAAHEVVEDHDLRRRVLAQQQIDGGRADQAGSARDKNFRAFDVHQFMFRGFVALAASLWLLQIAKCLAKRSSPLASPRRRSE